MPFVPVSMPSVWNVPKVAGVPELLGQSIASDAEASASSIAGTAVDAYLIANAASQWGIFSSEGNAVLTSSHVRSLDIERMAKIASAPQENGAFLSYAKVQEPGHYTIEMLCDGSGYSLGDGSMIADTLHSIGKARGISGKARLKEIFIEQLENLRLNTNLYYVATPEYTYSNANILGYQMRRSAERGVDLLYADIFLQEVRKTTRSAYTTTAQPQGEPIQYRGNVQASAIGTVQDTLVPIDTSGIK